MSNDRRPVLIVGAGPTGLVLALWLTRVGVPVRLIDKAAGPGTTSRAMVVQARTLEFYRQLGIVDEILSRGIVMSAIQIYREGRALAQLPLGDFGGDMSPYPFMLSLPQDEHEQVVADCLKKLGVEPEWNTELTELCADHDVVKVNLTCGGSVESAEYPYVCGCDGSRSRVREELVIGFPGGTYEGRFFVADVALDPGTRLEEFRGEVGTDAFYGVFPIRTSGMARIIGAIPPRFEGDEPTGFEDLRSDVERTTDLGLGAVNWFSVYKVHHRVADRFRQGRVFLLGDAGHVHSPAGGQGMNTGIGDAVNLAWKLAEVIKGRMEEGVLDSYEVERISFARRLVQSTDRAFRLGIGQTTLPKFFRSFIVPHVLPHVIKTPVVRSSLFRLVSQVAIQYRQSSLSGQGGGDRLPWISWPDGDNYGPLKSLGWQVHVYGDAKDDAEFGEIPVHRFPRATGMKYGERVLVRPDGYVACRELGSDTYVIRDYLRKVLK